ncbi:hypothetical protein [Tropicibacter sp. Alg240-R139]|nr:hypothetical protein [Tropicibacter sp. Alg240-R139]
MQHNHAMLALNALGERFVNLFSAQLSQDFLHWIGDETPQDQNT